jgi:TRAP-type C4-dicarboxylate transport system substrate-binding protein
MSRETWSRTHRAGLARIVATSLLALATTASGAAHGKTLKVAAIVPDGTPWMAAMRAGAEEIHTRTEGRVTMKLYPGGVMGDGKTVLRKMRIGQLHGGAFTAGGLRDIYADGEIYGLPFLFASYDEVDFVRERMDPVLRRGFATHGLEALAISEGGFAFIMSRSPIQQVSDLAGLRVWTQEDDPLSQAAWEAAGIAPVPLPLQDVFTALQTGLIDTVVTPPVGAIAFQWHTRLRYVTEVPLSYVTGVLAFDARAMAELAPGDRDIVREVIARTSAELDVATRRSDQEARDALRSQGLSFIAPTQEELLRWRAIAETAMQKLARRELYTREAIQALESHLAELRSVPAEPAP